MFIDLQDFGFSIERNIQYKLNRKNRLPGEYFADLKLKDKIIIEVKAVKKLADEHTRQILNYLRLSDCRVGFLVDF